MTRTSQNRLMLVTVAVFLGERQVLEDDEWGRIRGYYQNLGVAAGSEEEARRIVAREIDGRIDWDDSAVRTLDPEEALSLAGKGDYVVNDWKDPRIWYRSGRVFFPED